MLVTLETKAVAAQAESSSNLEEPEEEVVKALEDVQPEQCLPCHCHRLVGPDWETVFAARQAEGVLSCRVLALRRSRVEQTAVEDEH